MKNWIKRRMNPREAQRRQVSTPDEPQERGEGGLELAQINIRGDRVIIERFRQLCREDRRTYADMLSILLKAFNERKRGR